MTLPASWKAIRCLTRMRSFRHGPLWRRPYLRVSNLGDIMFKHAALIFALSATAAAADLRMEFREGAPKDRFTLTNTGDCALPAMQVTLDLGTAPAGLIFDVTGAGAGVEVFQPFELVSGAEYLANQPAVVDGDAAIRLDVTGLGPDQAIAFTIDVDDTGGGREITVSGSEIAGAEFRTSLQGQTMAGTFGSDANATIALASCTS